MQYTTHVIKHYVDLTHSAGKRLENELNQNYTMIINQYASQGWRLLGIHQLDKSISVGCFAAWWRIINSRKPEDRMQIDVLIFFRE